MRLISKLLCSTVLVCASLAASASPYSSLVIFGDSLSDSGNNTLLGLNNPGQIIADNAYIPKFTYSSGTYSDGPVWATQFADMLGLQSFTPALDGGTNFAFGGATTSVLNFPDNEPRTPTLIEQMGAYFFGSPGIKGTGGIADSEALYVVAGGGNNIREVLSDIQADPTSFASIIENAAKQYVNDIGFIVDTLQAQGAKNIIVWNTPNVGLAPAVTEGGPLPSFFGTTAAETFNSLLGARLTSEVGVQTFDLFGLATQAKANGFTNTTDACGVTNTICNTSLFWDGIHPTTAAHTLIAERMLVTAVPEPETWALMLMGLGFIGYRARSRAKPTAASA